MTEPRWDLIRHIRHQIAAGTYDTPKRMEMALGNMTRRLEQDCLTSGSESVTVAPAGHDNNEHKDAHGQERSQPG